MFLHKVLLLPLCLARHCYYDSSQSATPAPLPRPTLLRTYVSSQSATPAPLPRPTLLLTYVSSQSATPAPLPRPTLLLLPLCLARHCYSCPSASPDTATPAPLPRPTLLLTYVSATRKHEQCTQTDAIIDVKIENKLIKNEISNLKQRLGECQREKVKDNFCVNDVIDDYEKCKLYTGLTWMQFMCMWNFLGSAKDKLI